MHLRALGLSDNLCPPVFRTTFRAALSAVGLACAIASVAGCGSGIANNASPQTTSTVPTASALGPQLGYFWFSPDSTLRPILGIPGASQVGQSVVPAGAYSNAATSASAGLAILQGTDGSFDLMTLPAGSPVSLGLTLPTGARIKLSPSAAAALLYTPGAASASLVTGLLSTPKVQSITASGAITDSAVSDTGAAAFAYVQGSSVTVGVMALNGRSVPVASVGASGGLAFLPGSDSLLIGDAAANTLTLVQSSSSSPSAQTISAAGLLHSPVAVGVSNSGRWALVANSASQTLVRIDLSSFAAVSLTCNCKPTLSEALADDGAFRVTSLTAGPNWIVDATPATPRLLFIPALPGSTSNKTAVVASVARP